jgi:hypothetical protein
MFLANLVPSNLKHKDIAAMDGFGFLRTSTTTPCCRLARGEKLFLARSFQTDSVEITGIHQAFALSRAAQWKIHFA